MYHGQERLRIERLGGDEDGGLCVALLAQVIRREPRVTDLSRSPCRASYTRIHE